MEELEIRSFWDRHPCGEMLVGGASGYAHEYEAFFRAYDEYRYTKEAHILKCLDQIDFQNKETLEIGLGQGADAEQIIRRGAFWSGVDLTEESVARVRTRFELRKLPYRQLCQASVLNLPFDDDSFDVVFSHGVLHHVPEIKQAQQEIYRVLRPGGKLVVMLYAKWSMNYLVAISIFRRLGLIALRLGKWNPGGIYAQHLQNAQRQGLRSYLRMRNFIHHNTDGPLNPYSKVYDRTTIRDDFPLFRIEHIFKRFMHAPPLPVSRIPMERQLGWHLWVHMAPVGRNEES